MQRKILLLILGISMLSLSAGCRSTPAGVGSNSSEPLELLWSRQTGGAINQPPLALTGQVIVSPVGKPLSALDPQTGKLLWQFDPPAGLWERAYASDGERVFTGLKGGRLAALKADSGELLWQADLGIESQVPSLVDQGVLYVPTTFVGAELTPNTAGKARLFALNASSGELIWAFESGNYILQTPARGADAIFVGGNYEDSEPVDEGGHTRIYALNAADGTLRWDYESEDGFPKRLSAAGGALIFVGYQDFINGIDLTSGRLRWRVDAGNWTPSFAADEDRVYFGSANTAVSALDAASGERIWQFNIPEGTFNYLLGAPAVAEGRLYFLTQHGDIFCLDAGGGDLLWQVSSGISGARTGLTYHDGNLFVGDAEGELFAYRIRQ